MNLPTATPVVAGRGLGRHLVDGLLDLGAQKVYALARDTSTVRQDDRVVPVRFDLLDADSIATAVRQAVDATLLINNAPTAAFATPLEADPDAVRTELAVNFEGVYRTIREFVPVIEVNGGGAIVNILSLLSLASAPPMAGYSASKAAAHSLTQALRPVLASKGITVHGVYPGGIDTDMLAGIDTPKTPPAEVARGILGGLAANQEEIFPDPNAQVMSQVWWSDPKSFERAFSGVATGHEHPDRDRHRRGRADARPRGARPLGALEDVLDERLVIVEPDSHPYRGSHHGVVGHAALMQRIGELFELAFELRRVCALDTASVMSRRLVTFTARSTGRSIRLRVIEVLEVANGRVRRGEVFLADTAALLDTLTRGRP